MKLLRMLALALATLVPAQLPAGATGNAAHLAGHVTSFADENDNARYDSAVVDLDVVLTGSGASGTASVAMIDLAGSHPAVPVVIVEGQWETDFPPRGVFEGVGADGQQYLFAVVHAGAPYPDQMLVRQCGVGKLFVLGAYFGCGIDTFDAAGLDVQSGSLTYTDLA